MNVDNRSKTMNLGQVFATYEAGLRKTKIICTLGPACWDTEMLVQMIDAGMNIARFNFSHGDHVSHGACLDRLRAAMAQRPDHYVAVMLDTKGPEIRTGNTEGGKNIEYAKDAVVKVTTDYTALGNPQQIACSYAALPTTVKVGATMFVADGSLTLEVTEIGSDFVMARCLNAVSLGQKKNMNLPGAVVDLPTCTPQDEKDIMEFGVARGVDFIAASFVRKASDVEYIKDLVGPKGSGIKIISKIENQEGLHNFDEILAVTDAIMVARGDLGMEIAPEKVFVAQKWMIEKCNVAGKPVQTATQMLESMIKAPRPTRAEASDVANAVLDGTDCVMLSGESANGDYPINAVTILAKCAIEAEQTLNYDKVYREIKEHDKEFHTNVSTAQAVASAAVSATVDLGLKLILVLTDNGEIAQYVAKYRPSVPIFAASVNEQVVRQFSTIRGVHGLKVATTMGVENVVQGIINEAISRGDVANGDKIAVIHSINEAEVDESNVFKVMVAQKSA